MNRSILLAAACLLTIGTAHAATNGTLGTSSTGSQNVSVTLQDPADNKVRISGLFDANLGTINPGESAQAFTNFCMFHSSSTFSLTVQQDEVSSGFAVLSAAGDSIPLKLNLQLFGGGVFTSYDPVNGVARTGLVSNRSSETCNSGNFASGSYSITSAVDQPVGNYTGTLTFIMAVE